MALSSDHFSRRRFKRGLSLLALSFFLDGCQTLSFIAQEHQPLIVTTGKAENVESHDFALSQEQAVVGALATIESRDDDTLSDLARHFGLGFTDIAIANPQLDPWALNDNQTVLLPLQFILPEAPRNGIVLNLANMRMFYYPKNQRQVRTYPVGIGRDGWNTPLGATKIVAKRAKPAWTDRKSVV